MLEAANGDRLEALYILAIHTGLRIGELLGLRWNDLDLEGSTLRVQRTLSRTKDGFQFTTPKSGKGRSIKLTGPSVDALRGHLQRQLAEIERAGDVYQEGGLVFCREDGTPLRREIVADRYFKSILRAAGLPQSTRLHDLRHTCATLLLSRGVHPTYVQALLGHASAGLTLDLYSHWMPSMGSETAAMEIALS